MSTEAIARACARRPWTTLVIWVLALVLGVGTIVSLLELTSEGEITSNPESERGYELIGRHFPPTPDDEYVNELILVRSASLTVADPSFRDKVGAVLADVRASGVTHNAESFYESRDESLVSENRRATLIPVGLMGDCEEGADTLIGIVQAADGADFDVTISGECSADRDLNLILDEDLKTGELYFGLPAALVILILVFGTLVAAVVPLVVAIFSIGVALGLAAVFSQGFDLSVFLFQMTTVMGLAIAADYGLFIVSRYREERAAGRDELEAIAGAGATANRAVLFSGLAFVLAMSGLLLVPDSILRSLGVGALTVGLVAVVAALTLVPALLGLLGDKVNALRVPFVGRAVDSAGSEGRLWSAIARAVMRRPVVSLVVSVGLLLAAALPVLDLRLSEPGLRSFPESAAVEAGLRRARGGVRRGHGRQRDRRRRGRRERSGAERGRHAAPPPARGEPLVPRSGARAQPGRKARGRRGARRRRQPRPGGARRRRETSRARRPGHLRRPRRERLRHRRDRGGARLHRSHRDLASADHRVRAAPELHPADDRVPLDRAPAEVDPPQPAVGRGGVRPDGDSCSRRASATSCSACARRRS